MLTRRARSAFTLVELLVGIVITGLVATAVLAVTVREQRLARALGGIATARRTVREGADVLRYDLRAAQPADGVYAAGPDFIELRVPIGSSVICGIDAARATLVLPRRGGTAASLTAWVTAPEPGDTVLALATLGRGDSAQWRAAVLAAAPSTAGYRDPAAGARASADSVGPPLTLRLTAPLAPDITLGAALRFVRRVRYERYRAADGAWYLGYLDCLSTRATPCATVQPVSGPYRAPGPAFRYADSAGVLTADPHRIARITISLAAASQAPIQVGGLPNGPYADSMVVTVAPRN